jgi:transposase
MKELDGRKLDHKTLEELRIRAVKRVEAGESPEVVIESLGFSRPRIYEWLAAYREGGTDALRAKPVPGRPRKLSGSQMRRLYRIITSKNPAQLKFEFALWTRSIVRELIRDEFGVRLSDVSVGRLLRKLGLSPQKPLRRAYQQDPELVARWEKVVYPAIKRRAKRRDAQIFFADEARVQSDYHSGTTWAPVGETPVVPSTGARFSINLISAVSPRGELRFMGVEGRLNTKRFIEFLKRLLQGAERPVFLILDGHPVHRAKAVRNFVDSTEGMLELYYLPPYSPELNPSEHVWSQLKHHTIGKHFIAGPNQLRHLTLSALRRLQKLPDLVASFFRAPFTCYAKAYQ